MQTFSAFCTKVRNGLDIVAVNLFYFPESIMRRLLENGASAIAAPAKGGTVRVAVFLFGMTPHEIASVTTKCFPLGRI